MQVSKKQQRHQPQKGVNATFHNRQSCNLIHENPLPLCTLDVVVHQQKLQLIPSNFHIKRKMMPHFWSVVAHGADVCLDGTRVVFDEA